MFDPFGGKKRAATRAAVDALRPLIGTIQHVHGVPARFWLDPYVLGFTQFAIGFFAKMATGGKIAGADLGIVLADAYSALSNQNGVAIGKQATVFATGNHADFNKGADDAAAVYLYQLGRLREEHNNELVQRASAIVKQGAMGGGDTRSQIVAAMVLISFVAAVKERFELD
jgi:hypothetical protein